MSSIVSIIQRLHLTRAIGWNLIGTVLAGLTGPLVAILITKELSPELQGYYYTFSSLLALSVFLELGFGTCLVQFIGHEFAHLGIQNGEFIKKSGQHYERLVSLVKLSLRWYSVAACVLFLCLGAGGELFFRKYSEIGDGWRSPWWELCFASALNLVLVSINSVLEGCNQVAWTAKVRAINNLIKSLSLVLSIFAGAGLHSMAISLGVGVVLGATQVYVQWGRMFREILQDKSAEVVSWSKEILPMQWRMAISWAAGYFIFSFFNPLLFAHSGPKIAGQFGMSWAILAAIGALSGAFVNTRSPQFAAMSARGEFTKLAEIWRIALVQCVGVFTSCVVALLGLIIFARFMGWEGPERLLPLGDLVVLSVGGLLNQCVSAIAVRVRADKKEPFLLPSVLTAVVICGGSMIGVIYIGVTGVAIAFSLGMAVSIAMAIVILASRDRFRFGEKVDARI